MTPQDSSSPTTSDVDAAFVPAHHAVFVPDIGMAYERAYGSLSDLVEALRAFRGRGQAFAYGPEGARYPILVSGKLRTPQGVFPLGPPPAEDADAEDPLGFGDAPAVALPLAPVEGEHVVYDDGDDDVDAAGFPA